MLQKGTIDNKRRRVRKSLEVFKGSKAEVLRGIPIALLKYGKNVQV
jgi:hypothetical protein